MDVRVMPGSRLSGTTSVPGDKSIAHRWLILAATAVGTSRLSGLPPSLDVGSTAGCLSLLTGKARPPLDLFARNAVLMVEGAGSTWNVDLRNGLGGTLEVEGEGRLALVTPAQTLDCGNSGTTMRLLSGVVASAPFRSVLAGDSSLSQRPMARIAEPLRAMGAEVYTTEGHAPVTVEGAALRGIHYETPMPSAQVKSAVLLAGLDADGETVVTETAATRDHTERALGALGAPVRIDADGIAVRRFQHEGFEGEVPGDPSSAAFLVAAAAITGSAIRITGVGLNPSRLQFLRVFERMGVTTRCTELATSVGEPVGTVEVEACDQILPVRVEAGEVPSIIDEIPALAAVAAHAASDSWFLEVGELRVKETDRLRAVAGGIRGLGGTAAEEGLDLVVAGGGLSGGRAAAGGDHRMAMALAVAALGATGESRIDGIEAADVSFPGFLDVARGLGAAMESL